MRKQKPAFSPESFNPNYEERRDNFVPTGNAPKIPDGQDSAPDNASPQNSQGRDPGVADRRQPEKEHTRTG